jgi:hypothetical protein
MPVQKNPLPPVGGDNPPAQQDEVDYPKTTPRQDFVFAVKLFGIAGLVVLAFWWMNRMV